MNRYSQFLAGGALLATTALASGTVSAATILAGNGAATGTLASDNAAPTTAYTGQYIGTNLFGGTTPSAATVGKFDFVVKTGTAYSSQTTIVITIAGGEWDATSSPIVATKGQYDNTGSSLSITGTAAVTSTMTVFTDKLVISPTSANSTFSFIEISNATVKNLQSLATAGNTLAVAGSINNTALTFAFESIASKTLLTSVVPATVVVTANSTAASNATTPAFITFPGGSLTANVGNVSFTQVSAVSSNLTTTLSGGNMISTTELRITHSALSDPAFNTITITSAGVTTTKSVSQTASGVATFTLQPTAFAAGAAVTVEIGFNGTTAITGGSGTAQLTPTAGQLDGSGGAIASGTGSLGTVSRGGLSSQINTFQNSQNPFASYLRITNTGVNSGTFTVTVRNGDTGAVLGTYSSTSSTKLTGGALSPQGTLQLSASDLEAGASITASSSVTSYTLNVSASFNGYVQHMGFNQASGVISNLSAFRNGTGQNAP